MASISTSLKSLPASKAASVLAKERSLAIWLMTPVGRQKPGADVMILTGMDLPVTHVANDRNVD